ncbi:MAG: chromosome partitioning protein, partial [Acidimicrobiia bacterium]
MSLLCLTSARSGPGVTTIVLALAGCWPEGRRPLVVEADPDGGVLAARFRLTGRPGLATLAAASRSLAPASVWEHAQELPGGVPVLVGPQSAEEAEAVLSDAGSPLASLFSSQAEFDGIADCGRCRPGSPVLPLLQAAELVLVVARPTVEELRPAVHRLRALSMLHGRVGFLLVGEAPYGRAEVEEAFGFPVVASVPADPKAARLLAAGGSAQALRHSALVRSARSLAAALAARLEAAPG